MILKSEDPLTRKLFLFSFAHLLPMGCVRISSNSRVFLDHYRWVGEGGAHPRPGATSSAVRRP